MRLLRTLTVTTTALAALLAGAGGASAVAVDTPATAATFNGTVRAVASYGNTIYVAGNFTRATDDRGTFRRYHLAAVSAVTGRLLRWHPRANHGVYALAAYRGKVYAGGTFTTVDGRAARRVVRINARTGAVDRSFRPATNGAVRSIAVTRTRMYLGGDFTVSRGVARTRLAAYGRLSGRLLGWAPRANGRVTVLRVRHGLVWAGGFFNTINGNTNAFHVAAIRPGAGTVSSSFRIRQAAPVTAMLVTRYRVYVGAAGAGGHLYVTNLAGTEIYHRTFDGDVDGLALLDGVLYVGGHWVYQCSDDSVAINTGNCANQLVRSPRLTAFDGSGVRQSWVPAANSNAGVLAMTASRATHSVVVGGAFTTFKDGAISRPHFALFRS